MAAAQAVAISPATPLSAEASKSTSQQIELVAGSAGR
jgi:hypothetical protein